MTITEKKQIIVSLNMLADVFPTELNEMKQRLYLEAFIAEQVNSEDVAFAVQRLIRKRTNPYFPTPAEIIEMARTAPRKQLTHISGLLPEMPTPDKESLARIDAIRKQLSKKVSIYP